MEINGKIYRNLEGQVAYLTEKWDDLQDQIDDVRAHLTHYVIVEELPTEDIDTSAVYLVGPKGTAPDTYYEEWVYVQLEDESWTWEKLGDTASVDLSGYLQKQTGTTSYIQAYCKLQNGSQGMASMSPLVTGAGYIIMRDTDGQINVPQTPSSSEHATSKKYVDDNFVAKATGTSTYGQAYVKAADGSQTRYDISVAANANTMAYRDSNGRVRTKDPVNSEDAVNLSYANDHYLAKNTATSSYFQAYCKNTDGTQAMCNANVGVVGGAIPLRRSNGNLAVPLEPTENNDAASKKYVDDNATGVRYLHTVTVTYALNQDDSLTVLGHYVDRSNIPITSLPTGINLRIIYDFGKLVVGQNEYECAVSKLPRGFAYGNIDSPRDGVLYTYESSGVMYTQKANSDLYTMTVTDTVTLF